MYLAIHRKVLLEIYQIYLNKQMNKFSKQNQMIKSIFSIP